MVRRNTRKLYSIVLLTVTLVMAGTAQAKNFASFDCTQASTKVEKLICANADISIMDGELAGTYHRLLAHAKDKQQIIAAQRRWLRTQRNICDNHDCLMQVYVERVGELTGEDTAIMKKQQAKQEDHSTAAAANSLSNAGPYHFTLVQGKGIAVCGAYLKRLNAADYSATPPYCNIPETTNLPGFTALHRVPLTPKEVHTLYQRVNLFIQTGKQGSKAEDEAYDAKLNRYGRPSHIETLATIKNMIQDGIIKVWRYDPPVDIDNNGSPDSVIVWQGYPVDTHLRVCGQVRGFAQYDFDGRVPQLAFILADSQNQQTLRIDISRTRKIFGDPRGGYIVPGTHRLGRWFRPMGPAISIFKYRGRYYFDTFLSNTVPSSWGVVYDDESKRETQLKNTLAVFLRQHGKTQEMCKYHMTDSE